MHDFISFLNLVNQDQIDSAGIFRRQTVELSGIYLKVLQIQLSTPEVHSQKKTCLPLKETYQNVSY